MIYKRWTLFIEKKLVGGAITILKNMKVNWKDDIPYITENKIPWFETTNQNTFVGR